MYLNKEEYDDDDDDDEIFKNSPDVNDSLCRISSVGNRHIQTDICVQRPITQKFVRSS